MGVDERKRRLETHHAEGGELELAVLLPSRVRAWSVTMASTVPSTTPSTRAAASSAVRRGGLTFSDVS